MCLLLMEKNAKFRDTDPIPGLHQSLTFTQQENFDRWRKYIFSLLAVDYSQTLYLHTRTKKRAKRARNERETRGGGGWGLRANHPLPSQVFRFSLASGSLAILPSRSTSEIKKYEKIEGCEQSAVALSTRLGYKYLRWRFIRLKIQFIYFHRNSILWSLTRTSVCGWQLRVTPSFQRSCCNPV